MSAQYNFKDMTGARVGKLTVVDKARSFNGNARWRCRCDCGGERLVEGILLRSIAKRGGGISCEGCK